MRLGLSSVAFSGAPSDEKAPEVVARRCRALGLVALEIRPDYLQGLAIAPSAAGRIFRADGLSLVYATGTLLDECPFRPEDPHNPLHLDLAVARVVEAEMLRIFPGHLTRRAPSIKTARSWGAFAAAQGRRLVIENTGAGPGSNPIELAQFLRVAGAGAALNFDIGNAARAGFEPASTLAGVLDVTAMLHLKDYVSPGADGADAAPGDGTIDFPAVARALDGWSGPAVIEMDAGPQPWATLERWVRWLRSAGF
jgi:sugar phosphate isomerase/epimerase